MTKKVAVDGLSFTAKANCNLNFNNPKIRIPSNAAAVTKEIGLEEMDQLPAK